MTIQPDAVRAALPPAAARVAALLRSLPDTERRLPDGGWTTGEAAAHLVSGLRVAAAWARGDSSASDDGLRGGPVNQAVAVLNAQRIAEVPERSPAALATLVEEAAAEYLDATATYRPEDTIEWYDGSRLDVASQTAISLGELIVHGYDIAAAHRAPWPIGREEAAMSILGAIALMPSFVDQKATRGVDASVRVRMRGAGAFGIRVKDGAGSAQAPPEGRYDCTISADPVALLLVFYGRISQWGPVLRGKMMAYGRKPWLGVSLKGYFLTP